MKRRILSLLLAMAMMFSMLPLAAQAADKTATVEVDAETELQGSGRGSSYTHAWTAVPEGIVSFDSTSSRNATITGVAIGTTIVTHTYTRNNTTSTETWEVTVTAATPNESTIKFRIINGTWNALGIGNDGTVSEDGHLVTFKATKYDSYGYVYECGGDMEIFLTAILGKDNTLGASHINPDPGYSLTGMSSQDWDVEQGGITGSTATANEQMRAIQNQIHGYDDNMTPTNGFVADTVYVLTLTKSEYYVTGLIDNEGTVTNPSQTLDYEATSQAMVFTPAAGYGIVSVTEYINNAETGTPLTFTTDANGAYTYPAQRVVSDIKVAVTTEPKTYTVRWQDYDGTLLETDFNVTHGTAASYNSALPSREADERYSYVFAGWTPVPGPVTQDTTYTATYTEIPRTYTVTWRGYNREILETNEKVPYGSSVAYNGITPTRPADSHYTYTFAGWDFYSPDDGDATADNLTGYTVTGDVEFQAVFTPVAIKYTATVEVLLNGTVTTDGEMITAGESKDISQMIPGAVNAVYLKSADGSGEYIRLDWIRTGVYANADMTNGNFYIYAQVNGSFQQIGRQMLVINNADRTRYLPYYSVTYTDGIAGGKAAGMPGVAYYFIESHVDVSDMVPTWDGYNFLYWTDTGNTVHMPSTPEAEEHLDNNITTPWTLTAQWEEASDVHVTVRVTHHDDTLFYQFPLNIHLTYEYAGNADYVQYPGSARSVESGGWYNPIEGVSTYRTSYTDMPSSYAGTPILYSADASLNGYKLTGVAVEKVGNTYNVTVDLEFDPAGFELEYTVQVTDTPDNLVPKEVDVKVMFWDGIQWTPIVEHADKSVAVHVEKESEGLWTGTGSFHVWGIDAAQAPYLYRVAIVGVDGIGSASVYEIPMTGTDHESYSSTESGFFPAGAYTGEVEVSGSASSKNNLYGAYWDNSAKAQVGEIVATVSGKSYTIVLHDNYSAADPFATIQNRYTVPNLGSYAPTRAGCTFVGWNLSPDGKGAPISGTEYIKNYNIPVGGTMHLYAQWRENLTVMGTVVVDLGYPCTDATRTTTVMLQHRNENDASFRTLYEQDVSLGTLLGTYATGTYVFADVPSTGEYRILVNVGGGTVLYQNEPASNDSTLLYDRNQYSDEAYLVLDSNDDTFAVVNIYMKAAVFELGYRVDASAISENFRPSDIHLDLYHDHGGAEYEKMTGLPEISSLRSDGKSDIASIAVPPYHANGYLYDYTVSTATYDVAALQWQDITHRHHLNNVPAQKLFAPFVIQYDAPANYSDTQNADGLYQDITLVAKFVPNTYHVTYNLNGGQWKDGFTPVEQHTWSFDTELALDTHVPVRTGYTFAGWTADNPDNIAGDKIPASVWTDVVLTARWEKDTWKDGDPDSETGGDGIPDKYQVLVYYTAGTGGTVSTALEVLTLGKDASGEYLTAGDVTASGSTAIPDADNDYVFDGWQYNYANVEFDKTKAETGEYVITGAQGGTTYVFNAAFAEDRKGSTDPQKPEESDGIADKYQVFVEFYSSDTNGTVTGDVKQTFHLPANTDRMDVTPSLANVVVSSSADYVFDIWTRDSSSGPVVPDTLLPDVPGNTTIRFYAHFAKDEQVEPGKDPDPDKPGDDIPDKYQVTVTYKVVNGYWNESKDTADKDIVFTLYTKKNGAWSHIDPTPTLGGTIPTGMVPDDSHIQTGLWDKEVSAATTVDGNEIYTYTFGLAAPSVDVEKTVDKTSAVVGDTVVYSITVTNNGNVDLGRLTVRENFSGDISKAVVHLPDGVKELTAGVYEIASLAVGNSVAIGLRYVVTDADAAKGALSNSVRVESDARYDLTPDDPADEDQPVADEDKTDDVPVHSTPVPPITPTGSVTLTKVDEKDHATVLPGVVFELYRSGGQLVNTYTTDRNGEIYVSGLPIGTYYWREIRSAEGYVLDETEHTVTVRPMYNTTIVVENARNKVPDALIDDHYAYIIGYDDGMVHPEAFITRAQVATIFFRLLNEETRAQYMTGSNNFSDVEEGMWFNTAVSTMAAMGIVTGRPGGVFDPDANITRAEFAAIAARFDAHGNTSDASFTDIYDHWAKKEINIAANNGWVLGYEDGTFHPDQFITRAEAMTMVNRVLQRIPETVDDLLPHMVVWPDNMDTTKWYYLMVQEATNSHHYGRKTNGYEYWTKLREVPDWTVWEK